MNVSRNPTRLRRAPFWVGMLIFALASGCRDHGGGGSGSAPSASAGDWDQLVWDQSNWT